MTTLQQKRDQLLEQLRSYRSCAVAFSAGVDSTVVAKAAQLALGEQAVAVTGTSASLAAGELEQAIELAEEIGIRHTVLQTEEFDDPNYLRNAPDRCFHCKDELYRQLEKHIDQLGVDVVVNGANYDDRGDYRPGMKAAEQHQVHSPLLDCEFTKDEVRQLAAQWQLPVWDKPATPCLSSRVAYGEEVTPDRLAMIDAAESFLRQNGFPIVRVRYHRGDLARVEVPVENLVELLASPFRQRLTSHLREVGFRFISIDIEGFRSGNLNQLIQLQ